MEWRCSDGRQRRRLVVNRRTGAAIGADGGVARGQGAVLLRLSNVTVRGRAPRIHSLVVSSSDAALGFLAFAGGALTRRRLRWLPDFDAPCLVGPPRRHEARLERRRSSCDAPAG